MLLLCFTIGRRKPHSLEILTSFSKFLGVLRGPNYVQFSLNMRNFLSGCLNCYQICMCIPMESKFWWSWLIIKVNSQLAKCRIFPEKQDITWTNRWLLIKLVRMYHCDRFQRCMASVKVASFLRSWSCMYNIFWPIGWIFSKLTCRIVSKLVFIHV